DTRRVRTRAAARRSQILDPSTGADDTAYRQHHQSGDRLGRRGRKPTSSGRWRAVPARGGADARLLERFAVAAVKDREAHDEIDGLSVGGKRQKDALETADKTGMLDGRLAAPPVRLAFARHRIEQRVDVLDLAGQFVDEH